MNIKEYAKPRPHILIDEIFSKEEEKQILDECIKLDPIYKEGLMYDFKLKKDIKHEEKEASDIFLDKFYENKRENSDILKIFDNFFWGEKMREIYTNSRYPIFDLVNYTSTDNTHIIRYGDKDFYDWHHDKFEPPYGFVTMSYMICSKPKKFTGGDFQLKWNDEIKTIKFKSNKAILFPSITQHRATPVQMKSKDKKDYRYTIQQWSR